MFSKAILVKKLALVSFIALGALSLQAQNNVGIGTTSPDSSAALDIQSTDKGLLIPRMSSSVREAISNPAEGLMVYDSTLSSFYFYTNSQWQAISAGAFVSENGTIYPTNTADDFILGADSLNYGGSGTEYKLFFDQSKGAFRAGGISNQKWDTDSLGNASFAVGSNNKAGAFADVAFGYNNSATGNVSFASGSNNVASNSNTFVGGSDNVASQPNATAFGQSNTASGTYSFVAGVSNTASSAAGTAFGENNRATDAWSTAFGYNNLASDPVSTAFGINNTASGAQSTAFGKNNLASGTNALAVGSNTIASGTNAFAMGDSATAGGTNAAAFGDHTEANSYAEVAMGAFPTTYIPNNAIAFDENDRLFTLGNGTSDSTRSNAMIVYKNGNTAINGALTVDSTYTFPTTAGTDGQVLTTDGNGNTAWLTVSSSSGVDSDDQTLSILNDTVLSITDNFGGNSVSLASLLDNTDDQSLSLNDDTLSISGPSNSEVYLGGISAFTSENGLTKAQNTNDDFLFGTDSINHHELNPDSTEHKMVFLRNKGSFFVGGLSYLDPESDFPLGAYSFYSGSDHNFSGNYSFVTGYSNSVSGDYSLASGRNIYIDSDANYSLAFGQNSRTWAQHSVAGGFGSQAYGQYAFAFGNIAYAQGEGSVAFGKDTSEAIGDYSLAFGVGTKANAYNEIVMGSYNTPYTANSTSDFNSNDRLFTIANGQDDDNPSDALIVYKSGDAVLNGTLNIDSAYTFPITDGSDGQVITTDGSGNLTWQNNTDNDDQTLSLGSDDTLRISGTSNSRISLEDYKQSLSLSDNSLSISGTTGSIDLAPYLDNTDDQTLDLTDNVLSISNSLSYVDLSYIDSLGGNTEINGNLELLGSLNANALSLENDFMVGDGTLNYGGSDEQKMFFDKSQAAFRMGEVRNQNWDTDSLGYGSAAFGVLTKATGYTSFAAGFNAAATNSQAFAAGWAAKASGLYSMALGAHVNAISRSEMVIGQYNTDYTPNDANDFDAGDRVFTIGNGSDNSNRSDALIVYKSGNTEINGSLTLNDAYTLPTSDGQDKQVLSTDGNGNISWQDDSDDQTLSLADNVLTISNSLSYANLSNIDSLGGDTKINGDLEISGDLELAENLNINGDLELQGSIDNLSVDDDLMVGDGVIDYYGGSGDEYKLFFDKDLGAFRAGLIDGDYWETDSIGEQSVAMGKNTKAVGDFSVALGEQNVSRGRGSVTMGIHNFALSRMEIVMGQYGDTYTPDNPDGWDSDDRLFTIANGSNSSNRSHALIVYKSGNTEINGDLEVQGSINNLTINDAYTLPTSDGSSGHVLITDGNGNLSWQNKTELILSDIDYLSGDVEVNGDVVLSEEPLDGGLTTTDVNFDLLLEMSANAISGRTDANDLGGVFRIDTRPAQSRFQWYNKPTGSSAITTADLLMDLDDSGNLTVAGNVSVGGSISSFQNSDARLKKAITPLNSQATLDKLLSLQGVTYLWDDDKTGRTRPEGIQYGFTAQNIQSVYPELVGEDKLGYLVTDYGTYDAMYVEAFRALNDKIKALEKENQGLEAENQQLDGALQESNQQLKARNIKDHQQQQLEIDQRQAHIDQQQQQIDVLIQQVKALQNQAGKNL